MNLLRIEYATTGFGMWHTLKEDGKPLVSLLTNEEIAELPMPHNDSVYGQKERRWYSAVASPDKMKLWFTEQDAIELLDLGFHITQFDADEWVQLERGEIIFTKESVTNWKIINLSDIY